MWNKFSILIAIFFFYPLLLLLFLSHVVKCLGDSSTLVCVQFICSRAWKENTSQLKGYAENIAVSTV